MRSWLRRLLYLVIVAIWLVIMLTPLVAIRLARHGQVTLGDARLFLVQSQDANGVGLQTTHAVADQPACHVVRVRYIFWDGGEAGVNTVNCACDDGVERVWIGRSCAVP